MSTELAQLFPTGKEIRINDENLTIKPFKFGELPRVFKAIEPLTASLSKMFVEKQVDINSIAQMIAEGGDSVIDLMVVGSKKPREWVAELEMDGGVDLLITIIEVNADFFIQKVLPQMNAKMEAFNGQTSS